MSGMFGKKEKRYSEPIRWKKELKLGPGYLLLTLWIFFTLVLLGWVLCASFSTTKEIFSNKLLESGFHFENYVKAWVNSDVSTIFFNSLFYSIVSCTLLIVICAPAAYALSRFDFVCNKLIQTGLVASMGVPVVMIVLPLFAMVAGLNILNNVAANRGTLIFLYIGINVPYTTIFLTTFFANLSRAFEEAAAIDGCGFFRCLFQIVFPLAMPILSTVAIIQFFAVWNEFSFSLILVNSDTLRTVPVGLTMFKSAYTVDYPRLMAGIMTTTLPVMILYFVFSKRIIEGMVAGAVKG